MKGVILPWGGQAVRQYRFKHARDRMGLEAPMYEGSEYGSETAGFFVEHGLDFDFVWTNAWADAATAYREILRDRGAKVIAEVDDLFEEVPVGNQVHKFWRGENKLRYKKLLTEADVRVASTPFLAERFGARYAPNFIEPKKWDFNFRHRKNPEECILLCPAGNGRAGDYFEIEEPLKRFLAEEEEDSMRR